MMKLRMLGEAFDFKTEAIRLAHKMTDWTYILVTFGPGGSEPFAAPLGDRDLLDRQFKDAVLDKSNAYIAKFDKTQDDFEPIEELVVENRPEYLVSIQRGVAQTGLLGKIKKFGPYLLGAAAAIGLAHYATKPKTP